MSFLMESNKKELLKNLDSILLQILSIVALNPHLNTLVKSGLVRLSICYWLFTFLAEAPAEVRRLPILQIKCGLRES